MKLPVGPYAEDFKLGGEEGCEWIAAVDKSGLVWTMNMEWKEPEEIKNSSQSIKSFYMLENGASICQETTALRFKLPKI